MITSEHVVLGSSLIQKSHVHVPWQLHALCAESSNIQIGSEGHV